MSRSQRMFGVNLGGSTTMVIILAVGITLLVGVGLTRWVMLQGRVAGERQIKAEAEIERVRLEAQTSFLEEENLRLKEQTLTLDEQVTSWRDRGIQLTAELEANREQLSHLREEQAGSRVRLEQNAEESRRLHVDLVESRTLMVALQRQSDEKIALLLEAKQALTDQFKSLANDILEEKSVKFVQQNQLTLGQMIDPLKEKIHEFRSKVEELHGKGTEQQATLRAELEQLKSLNLRMTEEAHGLAVALRGQVKKQGNWGELVLENVLDRSGLRPGQDFCREVSFESEEGRRRPDVVVYLPQQKHLVIDAKVSLNAYTRYVNAEDEPSRLLALQEHVKAMGDRIEELADRHYFELPGLNSPSMVFMFVPIESAFVEALKADDSLFQKALKNNVLVATPTTLLTSLNIVRQLWRFEDQTAHTAELAERAGKVYRKLVTFLGSMESLGSQLDRARQSFDQAMGQLYSGKGNLINQAKEFERLGVAVQGQLPQNLVEKAALELDLLPATAGSVTDPD